MVVVGVDPHKHSHTAVAVDHNGRELAQITVGNTAAELIRLLEWALHWPGPRRWAIEDCRHVAGALLRALLGAGQSVVTVPPKLMAQARASARTRGKSDPIDALAVARAALREPDLPEAHLDEQALEIRLLLDHREDLVAERTRMINRLRWHLHDLEISLPAGQALNGIAALKRLREQLDRLPGGVRAEIAAELIERIIALTRRIGQLKRRIETQIKPLAPDLLALPGCAGLTAAKILAETAGVGRFRSPAAFAMHAGTAPIPVWTGATAPGSASTAVATGNSTPPCTASRSPSSGSTHPLKHSFNDASPPGTREPKPCGCYDATSPTWSIAGSKEPLAA